MLLINRLHARSQLNAIYNYIYIDVGYYIVVIVTLTLTPLGRAIRGFFLIKNTYYYTKYFKIVYSPTNVGLMSSGNGIIMNESYFCFF